jgi:putative ABC transport system permease protein
MITAQSAYANNLLLGVIATLAAVALVNTLIMATVERREPLRLLQRVGATTRQLLSMTGWQTIVLSLTGVTLGAAAGAASVLVVSKVLTGTWAPYLTWPPILVIISAVLALTGLSVFVPIAWILAAPGDR